MLVLSPFHSGGERRRHVYQLSCHNLKIISKLITVPTAISSDN